MAIIIHVLVLCLVQNHGRSFTNKEERQDSKSPLGDTLEDKPSTNVPVNMVEITTLTSCPSGSWRKAKVIDLQ